MIEYIAAAAFILVFFAVFWFLTGYLIADVFNANMSDGAPGEDDSFDDDYNPYEKGRKQ